ALNASHAAPAGTTFSAPTALASDASGTVWVYDAGVGVVSALDGTSATTGIGDALGFALDPAGNVFVPQYRTGTAGQVGTMTFSGGAFMTSGQAAVGEAQSPQVATLRNVGNAPLHISSITTDPNFPLVNDAANCAADATLDAAASCGFRVQFKPRSAGALSGA